ncbi:MAG: hypothetical protein ACI8V4_001487 [Ilumatobacter sp.]|jgi:hypothetical protein
MTPELSERELVVSCCFRFQVAGGAWPGVTLITCIEGSLHKNRATSWTDCVNNMYGRDLPSAIDVVAEGEAGIEVVDRIEGSPHQRIEERRTALVGGVDGEQAGTE